MNVQEKVHDILIEALSIPQNEMKDNRNLVEDFYMDELDLLDITLALEGEFEITIEDAVRRSWVFVKDIIKYVEEATKK